MLALILAGGEGTRLQLGEKGLVPVHGKPMISWVIEAFTDAGCEPIVVTSPKTPYTKNLCRAFGVDYIDTAGVGYVEDMNEAVEMSGEEGALFTSAADTPALTGFLVQKIQRAHKESGKPACSVWVPVACCTKYQMQPRYKMEINGISATPSAINILTGSMIDEVQDEFSLLLDEPGLAFNINTREELLILEREFDFVRRGL